MAYSYYDLGLNETPMHREPYTCVGHAAEDEVLPPPVQVPPPTALPLGLSLAHRPCRPCRCAAPHPPLSLTFTLSRATPRRTAPHRTAPIFAPCFDPTSAPPSLF